MQLAVENVAKSFGVHEIFKGITFTIDAGEKVGLVGVNGSGKTTLIRLLLQPESADAGSIKYAPGLRLGYVAQGFGTLGTGTLWQYMEGACSAIVSLRERLQALEEKIMTANEEEQEQLLAEYGRLEQRYVHLDGYHYEANIKRVLLGLGFPEAMWQEEVTTFSGGQKTRLMLAGALVNSPDLLILDEPTNHLDIQMTEWLEEYLQSYKGGLLLVSHDRFFLDKVVDKILEMEVGKLQSFRGNYSHYLEQKAIQTATLEAAYAAQQDYIAKTEAYIRRFKAGIKSKMARGRQSRLDRLERMEAPVQTEEFALRLPHASESAERVVVLEELAIGYGEHCLAKGLNLTIRRGEKVAILGANGTGKTTLLKTILQELEPLAGKAKLGNRVQLGYFSQSYERLNQEATIMEDFLVEYGYTDEYTRKLLGGMLFHGDDVFKPIKTLSGGQKARLVLLKLVLDGANFLLLDEPTNHLDILAKEVVEAALEVFDGTLLIVSHDRYLIKEIADRIWELDAQGVHDYKGDYSFYLEQRSRATEDAAPGKRKVTEAPKEAKAAPAKQTQATPKSPVREHVYQRAEAEKLLPKVELQIREQEALQKLLERQMAQPESHADLEQSARLAQEYQERQELIDSLMLKWEKLMESLEE